MGNAKSMNRAEIETAAANGKWDHDDEILTIVQDVQANKKKRSSRRSRKERSMEANEIDEIYDLVLSLKNGGREGEDLLEQFVQKQTRRSSTSSRPGPPIRTIMVDTSSASQTGRRRARAA